MAEHEKMPRRQRAAHTVDPANPLTEQRGPFRVTAKGAAAIDAAAAAAGQGVADFIRTATLGRIALEAELTDPALGGLGMPQETREHVLYLLRTGGNVGKT